MSNVDKLRSILKEKQNNIPIQTVEIAKDLGIPVFRTDQLPDSISGMIKRSEDSDSGYMIIINSKHGANRRRFTIAHEIAHYIFHENMIGDGITDDVLFRSGLSNPVEAQANRVAADILMPLDKVNEYINNGTTDIKKLAKIFAVSESAMAIRLGVPYFSN